MLLELKVCIFSGRQRITTLAPFFVFHDGPFSLLCPFFFPEVKIAIQDEEPAKLEEGVEDGNETVFQDDEAGHMMEQSKAKPKVTVSVPTFDYVEGRKKYIAFVIVSIFTLYSYVDSVIKIIPF